MQAPLPPQPNCNQKTNPICIELIEEKKQKIGARHGEKCLILNIQEKQYININIQDNKLSLAPSQCVWHYDAKAHTIQTERGDALALTDDSDSHWHWIFNESESTLMHVETNKYLVYNTSKEEFILERLRFAMKTQRWALIYDNDLSTKDMKKYCDIEYEALECIICYENAANVRILPCYHEKFCKKCMDQLDATECPLCRQKILSIVRVKMECI
eukprot:315542_1